MKRNIYSLKLKWLAGFLSLAFAIVLNPAKAQTKTATPEKEHIYRVKLIKVVDGKTSVVDTTINISETGKIQEVLKNFKLPDSTFIYNRLKIKTLEELDIKKLVPEGFKYHYRFEPGDKTKDSLQVIFLRKGNMPDSLRIQVRKLAEDRTIRLISPDSIVIREFKMDAVPQTRVQILRTLPGLKPLEEIKEIEVLKNQGPLTRMIIVRKFTMQDLDKKDKALLKKQIKEPVSSKNDLALKNLTYYPNPSNGNFNLSFTSEKTGDLSIKIFDVTGREVYNEQVSQFTGRYDNKINLSGIGRGIYFLKIAQGKQGVTKKLVVE